jgi:hypothetical protein
VFHEFGHLLKLKDTNSTALLPPALTEKQKGRAWLNAFFQKMEPKKGTSPTICSVILETSETSWQSFKSMHESRATFQSVFVSDLNKESAAPALKRLAHWTDGQIDKVWEQTGGHGGSVASIYSQVSGPISVEELEPALEAMLQRVTGDLTQQLVQGNAALLDQCAELFKLLRAAVRLPSSIAGCD